MTARSQPFYQWTAVLTLLAFVASALAGCGGSEKESPPTYQATGTVLAADGLPVPGGMIEFRSTEGKPVSAIGQIQPDGSFSLSTLVASTKVPGAVAGHHQVIVMPSPPDTGDIQPIVQPVVVPTLCEVKPDGANQFSVRLPQH
jgi:hypothetical protein